MKVKVKVFKFNPGTDAKPYYKTYEVPYSEGLSVLEAVRYINDFLEPLAFDYVCHQAGCGLCAMRINGGASLACATPIVKDKENVIEPLEGFRVIRDLFIDREELRAKVMSIQPWFTREEPMTKPENMPIDNYLKTGVAQMCRDCFMCHSECPAIKEYGFENYSGPYILTRIASRYFDTREGCQDERLKSAVREGLFNCMQCGRCEEICPAGDIVEVKGWVHLQHPKLFKEMMNDAEKKGLKPSKTMND
ncbi:MAG: succinate dehydrogenase/fumarate reductase iron-sulfur subunit [Deferribacterales bacterium]